MEAPHLVALGTWAHRVPSAAGHWLKIKKPQKTTEKDLLVRKPPLSEKWITETIVNTKNH